MEEEGAGGEREASAALLARDSAFVTSSRLRVRRSAPARALRRRKMRWSCEAETEVSQQDGLGWVGLGWVGLGLGLGLGMPGGGG